MTATSFRSSSVRSKWLGIASFFPGEATRLTPLGRFSCHVRGVIKRSRNGVRVDLVNVVEVHEVMEKDEIKGEVVRERQRRIRTMSHIKAAACFFEVSPMLSRRKVIRSLDELLAPSLTKILASCSQRCYRGYRGRDDGAACGDDRYGYRGFHGGSLRFETDGVGTTDSKRGANPHPYGREVQ